MMAIDGSLLILAAGVLVLVICLGMLVSGSSSAPRGPLARRAETVRRRLRPTGTGEASAPNLRVDGMDRPTSGFERLARRLLPRQAVLRQRLARTGRKITIGSYAATGVVLAVGTTVVLFLIARQPLALAVALGLLVGIGGPHLAVNRMIRKRLDRFIALFPDAIDLIVRGLKSGLPVIESVAAAGREMADPVGIEFRRIADAVKFGQTLEDAMWETAARLDTPEFKFFVISLAVQRETGGNLGETLGNLSDVLRRRRQMRLKIKAMSSEARASAMILGSLPFIMFGLIFLVNPDYEAMMFTDPRGRMALIAGLVVLGMGVAVMRKMVRFEI
ncbi:type II secretion system F family protein [Shumkonia mesophila]|uniref:type II secretion system F family protein n=1 Tax=Shumkonia mesophila TaxID=2838854 RepID=UPI002934DCAB|nr:type II secretion system F family protein [Shumkonia mesophila]